MSGPGKTRRLVLASSLSAQTSTSAAPYLLFEDFVMADEDAGLRLQRNTGTVLTFLLRAPGHMTVNVQRFGSGSLYA